MQGTAKVFADFPIKKGSHEILIFFHAPGKIPRGCQASCFSHISLSLTPQEYISALAV